MTKASSEPWCSLEDVIEGPVRAVLRTESRTLACRLGPSPKYELLRLVRKDVGLERCLARLDAPAWVELELQVDGRGRIERIEVEDGDGAPLVRCVDRLRTFRVMPLGCRWRATVTLGSFGL